jgi:hypothetical protein
VLALHAVFAVASAASQLEAALMTQPQRRSTLGLWLGFATALMCALAGGAVWSVLTLRTGYEIGWFALVCAGFIAWALRANGYTGTRLGAVLAALFTALACIYAQCLLAIGDVAQALGFSLRDTIFRIGADFALAVVRGRISPWQTAFYVIAMVLSAWLVWRGSRGKA